MPSREYSMTVILGEMSAITGERATYPMRSFETQLDDWLNLVELWRGS